MTIEFRVAEPNDAVGILSIYAPYCESTHVSFEIVAPSTEQMRERIAQITANYPWLVGIEGGVVAGYVYASQHRERAAYRWAVDVAVYVGQPFQRRGLGRALYGSLFALLREQGYFRACAGITLPNAGSIGLHEAVGFRPVAAFPAVGYKMGRWLDVGWWQLDLQPLSDEPAEPKPFSAIRHNPEVTAILAAGERQVRS